AAASPPCKTQPTGSLIGASGAIIGITSSFFSAACAVYSTDSGFSPWTSRALSATLSDCENAGTDAPLRLLRCPLHFLESRAALGSALAFRLPRRLPHLLSNSKILYFI